MREFMMLMRRATTTANGDWGAYIEGLKASGTFRGGSSLANGFSACKESTDAEATIGGFMRFEASSIDEVRALLEGNPLYEAGGTVEIVELVRD